MSSCLPCFVVQSWLSYPFLVVYVISSDVDAVVHVTSFVRGCVTPVHAVLPLAGCVFFSSTSAVE